jgi:hypothetical protein
MKKFNKRAFVSVAMFVSLLLLPFSGIMNHNLQFEALTTERHFWMSVHNISAIIFAVFAILHISYNMKSLKNYISKLKGIIISKEALTATAFVILITGLFALHVFHVK